MAFNPELGSTSPAVLLDNAERLDKLVNGDALTEPDRAGVDLDTWRGMMAKNDEVRKNLIPLSKQYMTIEAAQADIANIPEGSTTYVRSPGNIALAFEVINNGGVLEPTYRAMPSQTALVPLRLANMFDDGGFRSGLPPKMKNAGSSYVTGKLVAITDTYLLGIGCKNGVRLPDGDTYASMLASPVKIPEPLYGKYVLMSALVFSADGSFGADSTCSYLADAGLNNITSPAVPYVNFRRDISANIRCYGTLAFVPADGSARYLHIGKAGLGAPSDSRFITGLC
ncbi:MAG: hypothetical protein E7H82_04110, partial [Klebsiella michiganensis]|nr:hypothetical protein [Klebsiella michiganensis]